MGRLTICEFLKMHKRNVYNIICETTMYRLQLNTHTVVCVLVERQLIYLIFTISILWFIFTTDDRHLTLAEWGTRPLRFQVT